jgi:endonuclease YncB( thermonuclease family)
VVIVTATLLVLQSYDRRIAPSVDSEKTITAPQSTTVTAPQSTIATAPQSTTVSPPTEAAPEISPAQDWLAGIARVIDGDTIDIRGTHIRLHGIDAPESKQSCTLNEQTYACGQRATEELIKLIGARTVQCSQSGKDRNGRVVAQCSVDAIDLSAWMVEHGWAIAYRKYSTAYVAAEIQARAQKVGIWAGTFVDPEEWRKTRVRRETNVYE